VNIRSNAARSALFFAAGLGLLGVLPAQSQEKLAELRDAKLASEWLEKADWITDYDKARAAAKESGKPIFTYFTRSYAHCPPCAALEKSALMRPEFAEFGKQVVLFCHVTSHVEGDPYQNLLSEKGGSGFPYLVFMDANGDVIAVHDGERDVEGLTATLHQAQDFLKLREKAASGDPAARIELFQKQLAFAGSYEKAQSDLAELKKLPEFGKLVDAARLAEIEQSLTNLEFQAAMMSAQEEPAETPEEQAAVIKKLHEKGVAMRKAGHVPDNDLAIPFWSVQLAYAQGEKDLKLFDEVVAEWKKRLDPSSPMDQRIIQALDQRRDAFQQEVGEGGGNDGGAGRPAGHD
jgi:hypothetical protein